MTGEIKDTYLSDLHSRTTDEEQVSFSQFTGQEQEDGLGTAIAVVTDPTGGIVDASDEFIPELGMPENVLNNFRSVRSNLNIDDDVKRHNTAAEKVGIKEKYREHLKTDEEAKEAVRELAERVRDGETITLVCFEKGDKWCHRHMLKEEIENVLSEL